jgi:transposase
MTHRELELLKPWLKAGVGKLPPNRPEVAPVLLRKRYLEEKDEGYVLRADAAERAAVLADRMKARGGRRLGRAVEVREPRERKRRRLPPKRSLNSPEGDEGEG